MGSDFMFTPSCHTMMKIIAVRTNTLTVSEMKSNGVANETATVAGAALCVDVLSALVTALVVGTGSGVFVGNGAPPSPVDSVCESSMEFIVTVIVIVTTKTMKTKTIAANVTYAYVRRKRRTGRQADIPLKFCRNV